MSPIVDQIPKTLSEKSDAGRTGHHHPARHQGPRAFPPRDIHQPTVHKLPAFADCGSVFESTDLLLPALHGNMGGSGAGAGGHHEEGTESIRSRAQIPVCR